MSLILLLLGFLFSIFLVWRGSDWVTDSLVPVAARLGTGYIAVTIMMVSALAGVPEIFTAVYSYYLGHLEVGLGVIIGSVMTNVGLTIGICAVLKPLNVDKIIVIRDGIFLIVIAAIVLTFGNDLAYSRSEGIVLLLIFIPYIVHVWTFERMRSKSSKQKKVTGIKKNLYLIGKMDFFSFKPSLFTFGLGALLLVFGSYAFAYFLVNMTDYIPLPPILIGILFGGIGTGIPDLAASIQATLKGYRDVAISETFGSNIFTLLVTLGILIVLKPFTISAKLFYFDLNWMIIVHFLLIALIIKGYKYKQPAIGRFEGIALILLYIALIVVSTVFF